MIGWNMMELAGRGELCRAQSLPQAWSPTNCGAVVSGRPRPDITFVVSFLGQCKEWADAALFREEALLGLLDSLKEKLNSGIKEAREQLQMAEDFRHDTVSIGHADLDITQYFREMCFYEVDMLPSLSEFCERRQISDKERFKQRVWRRLRRKSFRVPIAIASPPTRRQSTRWSDDEAWPVCSFTGGHFRLPRCQLPLCRRCLKNPHCSRLSLWRAPIRSRSSVLTHMVFHVETLVWWLTFGHFPRSMLAFVSPLKRLDDNSIQFHPVDSQSTGWVETYR